MKHSPFFTRQSLASSLYFFLLLTALAMTVTGQAPPGRSISDERINRTSEQTPSSLLVYNFYTSDATNAGQKDTLLTLTNTATPISASVTVHIFFISANGSVADIYVCLVGTQTLQMLASDHDPGETGYVLALAVNADGYPVSFNRLIGGAAFKLPDGTTGSLSAEGFSALYHGTLPGDTKQTVEVALPLDGKTYTAPAGRLAVESIPSLADGNKTTLILNSLQGNLVTSRIQLGEFFGVLYNDAATGFNFSATANGAQLNLPLTNTFPRTVPSFNAVIPTGRSGWMQVFTATNKAISGAVINYNTGAQTVKGAFNTSHNLQHLGSTTSILTIPVFPPNC